MAHHYSQVRRTFDTSIQHRVVSERSTDQRKRPNESIEGAGTASWCPWSAPFFVIAGLYVRNTLQITETSVYAQVCDKHHVAPRKTTQDRRYSYDAIDKSCTVPKRNPCLRVQPRCDRINKPIFKSKHTRECGRINEREPGSTYSFASVPLR